MRALFAVLALTLLATGATGQAQARRTTAAQTPPARPSTRTPARPARPAPRTPAKPAAPATPQIVEAVFECPSPLGAGVQTKRAYCDVLSGRDQADGIVIMLPPHTGTVTISFDLHNRHLYSEELIKAGSGYRRYTATIGLLTADNTLISRAIVQSEFRTAADLIERIGAEPGPATGGGAIVKAVAPTGRESIRIEIPQEEQSISILGEKLSVVRPDGVDSFTAPGRPVAVISNVMLEFRPAPVKKPAPARRR